MFIIAGLEMRWKGLWTSESKIEVREKDKNLTKVYGKHFKQDTNLYTKLEIRKPVSKLIYLTITWNSKFQRYLHGY